MSSYLVNFAKSGNPKGLGHESWKPFDGNMSFINLGDTISSMELSKEMAKFWQDYYSSILGL
jgi:para-nitrobenzyl esterase